MPYYRNSPAPATQPGVISPTPTLPASDTNFTNTYGVPCSVYISGGTLTDVLLDEVSVGGVDVGLVDHVRVPADSDIKITYSVAPSWVWVAD